MILRHAAPRRGAKTGVADYAEALHSAMAAAGDIRWEGNAGIWLYHIGNNSLHRDLYRRAIAQPGIVILHDAVLHHLFLGLLNEEEYTEEFVYNYGEWNRHLAARLWKRRSGSAGDAAYFAYPMLRRLTERSRLIVVHNHRAAAMVSAHGRDVRVEVIPHLAGAPNRSSEASAELRAKWGNGAVFGIFGHLRPSKRLASVFDAVQRVPGARVLVAGEFVDRQFGDALSNEMAGSRAIHLRFGNAQELDERISAVDAVINLRVPSAGETSGISIRAMTAGKPVIVSAAGEALDFPPGVTAAVDEGPPEREMLAAMMRWLADSPGDRAAMGTRARKHIERHHAPAAVAARLWAIARTLCGLVGFLWVGLLWTVFLGQLQATTLRQTSIPMRDGVKLAANVYLPSDSGSYPALLVRTPYGKGAASASYQDFVEHGYVLVVEDVRGRYESRGSFQPLTQEVADSDDTLRWIEKQRWSNGRIGMLGGSYSGLVQWKAAASRRPSLKAIFPVHAGIDEYFDRFYARGGAFRLGHRILWLAENLRMRGFRDPGFNRYISHVPLRTMDVAATGGRIEMLQQALDHPAYDYFWRTIGVRERLRGSGLPAAFLLCGWYDPNVESDLEWFADLEKGSREHRIVVGPWAHNMSVHFPGMDYGAGSGFPVRSEQLAWFAHYLKGGDAPTTAPVRIFVMGINRWRDEQEWPLRRAVPKKYYLEPPGDLEDSPGKTAQTKFTYDPRNPVPTLGGSTCCNPVVFRWGPMDQRPLEKRKDVLMYSSPRLTDEVEVTGPVKVVLRVSTTVPDTDFTAKLVDVFPDGEARNLTDGILRMRYREGIGETKLAVPNKEYTITIAAGVTSNTFLPGHRIRIEVSSSNFPKYDRNPNTGGRIADEKEFRTAVQTVWSGRRNPSYAVLPVVSSKLVTGAVAKW